MVKCLTQEHNMLVTAGLEPATFGSRVKLSGIDKCMPTCQILYGSCVYIHIKQDLSNT